MQDQTVERHVTAGGRTIFSFSIETFPGHRNNIYLIETAGSFILVDAGSGHESSGAALAAGMEEIRARSGGAVSWPAITGIIITHGHIDHFGGLNGVMARTDAPVYIHELDSRILSNFAERLIVASKDLGVFLQRAGVSEGNQQRMRDAYMGSKDFFTSIPGQTGVRDGDILDGGVRVIHTPGHCPGHICLLVDDILFAGDHILPKITPHQSPESITLFCGLKNYLDALEKVRAIPGIALALPGHGRPISRVYDRIGEIDAFHRGRLEAIVEICREPKNISQISRELFHDVSGYNIILALEETGAHVEYLYIHGKLGIANLDQVKNEDDPIIVYRSL